MKIYVNQSFNENQLTYKELIVMNRTFPLSPSQTRILLAELKRPGTHVYHIYNIVYLPPEDEEWLKKAIPFVFAGNLNLRMQRRGGEGFVQYVSGEPAAFEETDASAWDEEELASFIKKKRRLTLTPLFDAPLYRLFVIRTRENVLLYGVFHHLISDGTTLYSCLPKKLKDCIALLKKGVVPLPDKVTYSTFIARQREYLGSDEGQKDREYWLQSLTGYKGPGFRAEKPEKGLLELVVPDEIRVPLLAWQKANRISPFVLALGAASLYFTGRRFALGAGRTDMVWEISVNGRYFGDDIAGECGMFVETLPLRLSFDETKSFSDAVKDVKAVMKAGLTHARCSTNEYFPELQKRGVDIPSLISFSAVSNSAPAPGTFIDTGDETDVPFHIRVNLNHGDADGLQSLLLEYNTTLFDGEAVREAMEGILALLKEAAADPDTLLSGLHYSRSLLADAEVLIAENIKAADEPTSLPSGAPEASIPENESTPDAGRRERRFSTEGAVDAGRMAAAFMDLLVRFGMTKELLIGFGPGGTEAPVFPLGMKVDTSLSCEDFQREVAEKMTSVMSISDYPVERRTDLAFSPSVILSVDTAETADGAAICLAVSKDRAVMAIDGSRYEEAYAESLWNSLLTLYESFGKNPRKALKEIPLVPERTKDFRIELKNEGTVGAVLTRAAACEGGREILTACDRTLTLGGLNEEAGRIGAALIARGIKKGDRVMILMRRTSFLVTAIFGAVKAGAVFIPMDPDYPKERIDQIMEDSGAALILTDVPGVAAGFAKSVDPRALSGTGISVNHAERSSLARGSDPAATAAPGQETKDSGSFPDITPDDMCFIIYTSGTTGKPKGVALSHRGITNYIAPEKENAPIWALKERCSRMLCLSSISFIVFLREIFGTILNGVPVTLCSEEQAVNPMAIAELIYRDQIDAMGSTPTRLLQYLEVPSFAQAAGRIKCMIIGGEGFPGRLFDVIRRYSDCEIYNSYGPTEVTIASHQKKMESARVSAGFPMLNVLDRISDVDGNELPACAVGELYIGGAGVAIGYFHNEELTKSRFPVIDGIRYCNTGDLAYKDRTGEVFVLGRNDGMIKLRGLRIEPEEIENVLGRFPGISHARVIVQTVQGAEHLSAFFTLQKGADAPSAESLRGYLGKKLPPYMVPSFYTALPAFPMTPNGKVAVKELVKLMPDLSSRAAPEEPATETERAVMEILGKLLGSGQFGVRDDLFTVGLTSLTMVSLVSEIYERYGISVPVTALMRQRSAREIAEMIDGMKTESGEASDAGEKDICLLTQNQMGIYFDCAAHPEGIGYHLPNVIRFDRSVDPARLKEALVKAVQNHPYLCVTLSLRDGVPVFVRNDRRPFADAILIEETDSFTENDAKELVLVPFELAGESLFRFRIFVTKDEVVLFTMFHHLIADGTSLSIFFEDLGAAYDGRPMQKEKTDGFALSLEENARDEESDPDLAAAKAFFKKQLAVADEATALTADLKGDGLSGHVAVEEAALAIEAVEEVCGRFHISPNVLFMSAFAVALTKYNSDDKLMAATVSNGRVRPDVARTVSLLVKTMPLILKPERKGTLPELFRYVSDVWMNTMASQSYPFTRLSAEYDIHPDIFYTYHGRIYEEISLGGRLWERGRVPFDSLRYKLMLHIVEEDRCYIRAEYNDALYSGNYIRSFVGSMKRLILMWAEEKSPETLRICDMALRKEETEHVFHPLKEVMVHQTFELQVSEHPDREILAACGETLTYDALNRRANRIAHALNKRGVKEGSRVVLLLPRTADLIACMLGALKAGAAYIPMDVEYPKERVEYVIGDADADFVITSEAMDRSIRVEELLQENDETNPPIHQDPNRTAYMIYTSGSTGRPKGVAVSHKNLSNLCVPVPENNYFYTRVPMPESVIQTATVSFDASILDIMPPLLNGMRVIFANDEENRNVDLLVKLIRDTRPECLGDMTPSRLMQYLAVPEFAAELAGFTACSVGGEAFIPALYEKIRENAPELDIYNSYGPTETTIHSNTRLIRKENMMSVGKALYNVICDIRDIDGRLLPDGVTGELYIGGYGVSKGYNNMPEKTEEAFLTINGIPYYRSGDFAYKLPDEEIVVLGRRDGQIKLRGLRIEIGEVEQSMLAFEAVKQAAVVIRRIGKTEHLCGYFTAEITVDTDQLKDFLASRLTPYMVPTVLMQLPAMPYTPNGKLDRKKLPEPELKRDYTAPCNEAEEFFCDVFEEVLGIEKAGVTDNFFEIGGTSLLGTQVIILASNGGYTLRFRDIFENPTPRELAIFVEGRGEAREDDAGISGYDYSLIHARLAENTFENYVRGERKPLKRVILTGATGFLGSHILRELLLREDTTVYCMLRGGRMSAGRRLRNRLFYYFDEDFDELFGTRIIIKEGAITDPGSFRVFDDVSVDAIINCAASVKHFSAGDDIRSTNVDGVRNGLEYAVGRGIRYIHISTTSTAGEQLLDGLHDAFTYDERTLYKGQVLDNQYLSSKFLSERLVLSKAAEGADAMVIRVGNLMARDSDGIFQINFRTNGFINRIRAYAALGAMPLARMLQKHEMSPIDVTARAILALSETPEACCLFNCYNNHTFVYADIVKAACDSGIAIRGVTQEAFDALMEEAMHDSTKQEGISGLLTTVGMGTRKERRLVEVNNDYTTMVLYNEGIFWPVITEDYIRHFFEYLSGVDFWA